MLGLHFLNLSVESAYPSPDCIPASTYFNDQESIIEIIFEQVIGLNDYFAELDDPESETQYPKQHQKTELKLNLPVWLELFSEKKDLLKINPITSETFFEERYPQIDPPPPKS
jgi:hypothetical protein